MRETGEKPLILYWMLVLTALLLSLMAALLVPAERQERAARRNQALLARVNELHRSLTAIESMLATDDRRGLRVELRNCELRMRAVRDSIRGDETLPAALSGRLRQLDERTAELIVLARSGSVRTNDATGSDDRAIAAVGDLVHEVIAASGARVLPGRGLWLSLYALVGITAILLASIAGAQAGVARRLRRLYQDRRDLMESTPQVLLSFDSQGNPVRWNERLLRETGFDEETVRRARITDLFDGAAAPDVVQAIDTTLQRGVCESFLPLLCHGQPKEFSWLFSRHEGEGDSWRITISGHDVSARRLAEQRLRASEERYRNLFAHIRDAMFLVDENRVVEVNEALETMSGYTLEELQAMDFADVYENASDRQALLKALRWEGGSISDYPIRFRCKDGRVLDCLMSATLVAKPGAGYRFQGVIRDVSEKRRLEDALRRWAADYRGLFENAHDAILVLDPESEVVLDANRSASMLYGFEHDEFLGRSMLDLSSDPDRGREYLRTIVEERNGEYLPFESRQWRRDGTPINVEIKAAQVMYQGRRAIVSINRDVTAHKSEERRVRESEERFRLLLESVVDYSIFMVDPGGRIVSWNEGAERIYGYSAAEVTGRSFAMFHTPVQQFENAPARDLASAALHGRLEREELRMRKDGGIFHASVVVTRVIDEHGELRGFAEVTHDITQKHQLEETRKQIQAVINNVATEWTRTFDAVMMPVILLDGNGQIRRLNQAAARLAGETPKNLLGRDPRDLGGEPWQVIGAVSDFVREHGVTTDSRAENKASGRVWQVSSTLVDLVEERRLIVVAYDLTDVTRLEDSLRRAQITAVLGTLVAGVAHEVRNPLFTISATLDNCEARLAEVPGLTRYTVALREEVTRLNELMEELLDYGRPHTLNFEDASPAGIAHSAVAQSRAAATRNVEVRLECEDDLPVLQVDRRRLQQVLRNVVDNAIHYSPAGKEVVVCVRADGPDAVRWEVLDEGPGLSEKDLAQAFTPFYTKRKGGTGMGLAIAQKLVSAHGGEITLANRDGGGTLVTVRVGTATALSSGVQLDRSA